MPIDFSPLTMSELRNRPGEILDRVADNGEAFIIESNSRRKACLVPLSFFVPDVAPARIATEMQLLTDHGEDPVAGFTENRELILRFALPTANGSTQEVTILLPHGYPHSCPKVYVTVLESETPHRWADGALCLYGMLTSWNPGGDTVLSTLQLTRTWLSHYESWRRTGRWPQGEEMTNAE